MHTHTNNNFRLKLLRVNALQTRWLNGFSAADKDWGFYKELSKCEAYNWLSTNSYFIVWIKKKLVYWMNERPQWTEFRFDLCCCCCRQQKWMYCLHHHCPLSIIHCHVEIKLCGHRNLLIIFYLFILVLFAQWICCEIECNEKSVGHEKSRRTLRIYDIRVCILNYAYNKIIGKDVDALVNKSIDSDAVHGKCDLFRINSHQI